jgi:hypothetical protein
MINISVLEGGHPALWLPASLNLLTHVVPCRVVNGGSACDKNSARSKVSICLASHQSADFLNPGRLSLWGDLGSVRGRVAQGRTGAPTSLSPTVSLGPSTTSQTSGPLETQGKIRETLSALERTQQPQARLQCCAIPYGSHKSPQTPWKCGWS